VAAVNAAGLAAGLPAHVIAIAAARAAAAAVAAAVRARARGARAPAPLRLTFILWLLCVAKKGTPWAAQANGAGDGGFTCTLLGALGAADPTVLSVCAQRSLVARPHAVRAGGLTHCLTYIPAAERKVAELLAGLVLSLVTLCGGAVHAVVSMERQAGKGCDEVSFPTTMLPTYAGGGGGGGGARSKKRICHPTDAGAIGGVEKAATPLRMVGLMLPRTAGAARFLAAAAAVRAALPADNPHTPRLQITLSEAAAALEGAGNENAAGALIIKETEVHLHGDPSARESVAAQIAAIVAAWNKADAAWGGGGGGGGDGAMEAEGGSGGAAAASAARGGGGRGGRGRGRGLGGGGRSDHYSGFSGKKFYAKCRVPHDPVVWLTLSGLRETVGRVAAERPSRAPPARNANASMPLQLKRFMEDPASEMLDNEYAVVYFGVAMDKEDKPLDLYVGSTTDSKNTSPTGLLNNRIGVRCDKFRDEFGHCMKVYDGGMGEGAHVQYYAAAISADEAAGVRGGAFAAARFIEGEIIEEHYARLVNSEIYTMAVGKKMSREEAAAKGASPPPPHACTAS
jgi:hypothetical protein